MCVTITRVGCARRVVVAAQALVHRESIERQVFRHVRQRDSRHVFVPKTLVVGAQKQLRAVAGAQQLAAQRLAVVVLLLGVQHDVIDPPVGLARGGNELARPET
jgi:hypothetical protein